MSGQHTPEPWEVSALGGGLHANNVPICQFFDDCGDDYPNHEANARRIVACVNYCAGTESRVLEMSSLDHFKNEFSNLSKSETEKALRILELEQIVEKMRDSQIDKLLAMTDEQVTALCRLEGSNPDDSARLGKQAMQLACSNVRVAELEKQRDEYANEARRQMQHVDTVLKQRDELLSALERIKDIIKSAVHAGCDDVYHATTNQIAKEAIASAKGGAA